MQAKLRYFLMFLLVTALMTLATHAMAGEPEPAALVPRPVKVDWQKGQVQLDSGTPIIFNDEAAKGEAEMLASLLHPATGLPLPLQPMSALGGKLGNAIVFTLDPSLEAALGREGYRLEVLPTPVIRITAAAPAGLFYGGQTLRQLLPAALFAKSEQAGVTWQVPCCRIVDRPRFPWRGLLLDEGRHFFGKQFVKHCIDLLAVHKMNTLHWHLTDDQGWRIEIKKYPKLTEIGSWRDQTAGNGKRYGGFYTQDEIREIVAYAARRHVTIVPEIEMPGHSLAALTAYPQFSCTGGPFKVRTVWGVEADVCCAGNDTTFAFLGDVLDEVVDLFPSTFIHIGGDECPKDRWHTCPKCQARIKAEGLKNERELQSYFTRRIEDHLASKGRRLIGWDEILEGGLPPKATVMSWRGMGGATAAAESGHDYVATPTSHCYLNYPTTTISLEKAYSFEPIPEALAASKRSHCLGVQGNMWTEHTPTPADVDRLVWPRLCALAEVGWTPKELRSTRDFLARMDSHVARLSQLGVKIHVPGKLVGSGKAIPMPQESLSNGLIEATWQLGVHGPTAGQLHCHATRRMLALNGELFSLVLQDGTCLNASEMDIVNRSRTEPLAARPDASRYAERLPGKQLVVELASADGNLHATWRAILRDGSPYLRQQVTFVAGKRPIPVKEIILIDIPLVAARSSGSVDGSPVVTDTAFFAVEHPMSINRGVDGHVRCFLPRSTALAAGEPFEVSSVIGFVAKGQLRREFLSYLERERAHPYRPFLNYNTWYDIGFVNRFDAAAAIDAITTFGEELVNKRKTRIDSFLLDDGWDDCQSLWRPHQGFPNGFAPVAEAAKRYGAALGFWLSPWGGYDQPKKERLAQGRKEGFEIVNGSFSLAGPKYYQRFRGLCLEVIGKYGANHFKFDGIGSGSDQGAGSAMRDFDAMFRLLAELRSVRPDVYINQTTGTWPSPFWLLHADSIWRGGNDNSFTGAGSDRQRWITYRDADVFARIVSRAQLYPLNSLMLGGMIYARHANKLNVDPQSDFTSEVRSFFGSGTQMQEMYITPKLLTPANWDMLAASARWARANAETLCDAHWVGGDPAKLAVYGWAAWSPHKGILTLRNPAGRTGSIIIDAAEVFELPDSAPRRYRLTSPYQDQRSTVSALTAGEKASFTLQPYEVLVLEAQAEQ